MKKKMLYVSHVDWQWIKQRPHFLAEGFMEKMDVTVLYLRQNSNRKGLQKRKMEGKNVLPLYSIPLGRRIKALNAANQAFLRAQISRQLRKHHSDFVFLTYPLQIDYLPSGYSGTVIYDCMDDHIALTPEFLRETVREKEEKMLNRADIILHSSENLRKVLIDQYGDQNTDKMHLVRNGYSGKVISVEPKEFVSKPDFTISYIGTIGKWFNFKFILKSLEDIPNLHYKIVGPADVELPQHDRIEYTGTVEHDKLYDTIRNTDCLAMPFVVNDIVKSVDPVKLYEYINYDMNILCVKYPEVERFAPFVHFYEDYESFVNQIQNMMENNSVQYSEESRIQFLQQSSWQSRVEDILELLSEK